MSSKHDQDSSKFATHGMDGQPRRGALKMMSTTIQIAVSEEGNEIRSSYIIFPNDRRYMYWWYVTVLVACVTSWTEMFEACFLPLPGLAPYGDFWAFISYLAFIVFFADMVLRFFLAYHDKKANHLVANHRQIAANYLKFMFWVDLIAIFPFEQCALMASGLSSSSGITAHYIALLKILHLLRLYRLFNFFGFLEYNMTIGLFQLMLLRNYSYIFFITHWAACLFYFIAAQESFKPESWVGRNFQARFEGKNLAVRYIYSLYLSVCTFSSMGDGDFYAASPGESVFVILYLLFNLLMTAYIMGTVTVLVVKSDKRSKVFRDKVNNMEEYCHLNDIPPGIEETMKEHLHLQYDSEQVGDEKLLAFYPATIRRKVLRHLYLHPIRSCYLMEGCKAKFIDAFMISAKLELFMPQVQIMAAGDIVNELFILVGGEVRVHRAAVANSLARVSNQTNDTTDQRSFIANRDHQASGAFGGLASQSSTDMGGFGSSVNGGSGSEAKQGLLGPSQPFGEVAFLTQNPSPENVWSTSVCRVLVLSRAFYEGLLLSYPQEMRKLMQNLQQHAEEAMRQEIIEAAQAFELDDSQKLRVAMALVCRPAAENDSARVSTPDEDVLMGPEVEESLSASQKMSLEHLREVQKVVHQCNAKIIEQDTNDFLNAASCGKIAVVQRFLNQGLSANSCDYDHRTALMLASRMGQEAVVKALLAAGADPGSRDNFGTTAIFEACTAGHDDIIEVLLQHGVKIDMDGIVLAAKMCDCVMEGNLSFLRRLLKAGADPDAADYDKRVALHIGAAQGNLTAVKVMVEAHATVRFKDRFGNTAMDEALRIGAKDVVAYLKPLFGEEEYQRHMVKWKEQRTQRFLRACSLGDVEAIKFMLEHNDPPTITTGMMIAGSEGHTVALQALLDWGGDAALRQALGHAMLLEAAAEGNDDVLETMLLEGFSFKGASTPVLGGQLGTAAREGDVKLLQRLLRIGVSPDVLNARHEAALHTAVAEGDENLVMVRVLVEDAGADINVKDAADATPLMVAQRVGASLIYDYLSWAASAATSAAGGGGGAAGGGRVSKEAAMAKWGAHVAPSPRLGRGGSSVAGLLSAGGSGVPLRGTEEYEKLLADVETSALPGGKKKKRSVKMTFQDDV